jgi:hypothetical protein
MLDMAAGWANVLLVGVLGHPLESKSSNNAIGAPDVSGHRVHSNLLAHGGMQANVISITSTMARVSPNLSAWSAAYLHGLQEKSGGKSVLRGGS